MEITGPSGSLLDGNQQWDYRAVETLPFLGAMSHAGKSEGEFRYLGALRPMYAQEIQAKLLSQLGRVGVPVPPALAFESTVTLRYAAKGGKLTILEFPAEETPCYIVSARQSDQEGMLLFPRQFIRKLIGVLENIDKTTLSAAAAGQLKNLLSSSGRDKLRKLTAEGAMLEKDIGHGLLLTKRQAKLGDQSAYWGCLVVAMKAEAPEKTEEEPVTIASADPIPAVTEKVEGATS